jgi:hypothetical protein
MRRLCTNCRHAFTPGDLVRPRSKDMEADRKAAGLAGVRFLYYACPDCGTDDIFVDILPLDGEAPEVMRRRQAEMEAVVRAMHDGQPGGGVDAVVTAPWLPGPVHAGLPNYASGW